MCEVGIAQDHCVNGQRLQGGGGNTLVSRDSIVDEVGEVQRRVIFKRCSAGGAKRIGNGNSVTYQRAVGLLRQDDGIDVVAGNGVAIESIVVHGNGGPVGGSFERWIDGVGEGRIGNKTVRLRRAQRQCSGKILARGNDLIRQDHRSHPFRISDFAGDRHLIGRSWRIRRVIDLADVRRRVGREHGVCRAGCGRTARP